MLLKVLKRYKTEYPVNISADPDNSSKLANFTIARCPVTIRCLLISCNQSKNYSQIVSLQLVAMGQYALLTQTAVNMIQEFKY